MRKRVLVISPVYRNRAGERARRANHNRGWRLWIEVVTRLAGFVVFTVVGFLVAVVFFPFHTFGAG